MYEDFRGKRVLVTGASGGLGAAIAKAFGDLGCRVLVHYHTRKEGF
jgi:NAD(P)-dependent dehydrogenase (short-subunit alcohol dehydrogenase family)